MLETRTQQPWLSVLAPRRHAHYPQGLDDEPVLLACLNDDPDQLCILGGTYDPRRVSPVTCFDPTQHIYRTPNGNTLPMDGRRAYELIRLHPIAVLIHYGIPACAPGDPGDPVAGAH